METPRKLLETPQSRRRYNVARKGERDSLKSGRIGQSAAKLPSGKKVQRLDTGLPTGQKV